MLEKLGTAFRSWREASLAPFSVRLFRILWTAAFASNLGAVIQATGASWSMTTMTTSPQLIALVQTAAMLPIVVLALPAGALADNADRRLLMLFSQMLGAASAATLAILSFNGALNPWSLLALTAMIGAAVAMHQPAWQASVIDFVPRKALPAAISLNVLAFNTARSLGPAIGGALIAASGPPATFAINVLSFLGLILVLAISRFPSRERRLPPERMLQAMGAGLRFVGMSPTIQRIYLRAGLFGFGASALYSMMPLVAHTRFPGGPLAFGVMMASLGLGSLCGALIAAPLRAHFGNHRLTTFAVAAFGLAALGVAFSPWLAMTVLFSLIAGVSWIMVFTTTRTCTQLSSPRWVVGRTVSLGQVASFGSMSLGAAFWGAVASHAGLTQALAVSSIFLIASLLLGRVAALPDTDLEDQPPPPPRASRPPAVAVDGRTGPVVVTIEYDVPREQAKNFLILINELGRIRRRNGATRWSVQQDIDRPTSWIERIHCPTWLDHLRRLDRYTAADRVLVEQVETFRTRAVHPIRRLVERPPGSLPLA
jgi:MFS family permease